MPIDGDVTDWETKENVLRVTSILTQENWADLFPVSHSFYTYEDFLKAVAKWPAFCDDWNPEEDTLWGNTEDPEKTCARELSALFAHITLESGKNDPWYGMAPTHRQGLYYVSEASCASCDYQETSDRYPASEGELYYGRGPL